MFIKQILWATDGSDDSLQSLKYAELLAKKYKAGIIGLFIIPDYSRFIDTSPPEERNKFTDWIEQTLKAKEKKRLQEISKDLKGKGIEFRSEVESGVPHKEILRVADKFGADLIAMGKGREVEKFLIGGTALKVLRESSRPVLTARGVEVKEKDIEIKRILVPVDLSHDSSKSFKYSSELANKFKAHTILLNVVGVGDQQTRPKFPPEIIERMKLYSSKEVRETIGRRRIEEGVEIYVEVDKNAWKGIVKFVEERDIDLIVMMSYGGMTIKEEFIGSVTQKVIQEAPCPVISMNP